LREVGFCCLRGRVFHRDSVEAGEYSNRQKFRWILIVMRD